MPVTTAAVKEKEAGPASRAALTPYLNKLRQWSLQRDTNLQPERSARISIGEHQLIISPWERVQLRLACEQPESASASLPVLVAQGLALMVKCMRDAEWLRSQAEFDTAELYARQAELILDAALGNKLLDDVRLHIERLVSAGDEKAAKSLSQFESNLKRSISTANQGIADSEKNQQEIFSRGRAEQQAEQLSADMATQQSAAAVTSDSGELNEAEYKPRAAAPRGFVSMRMRRRKKPEAVQVAPLRKYNQTKFLGSLLGLACVVWFLMVLLPPLLEPELTLLARDDFSSSELITALEVRAPSLYFQIDAGRWEPLEQGERLALVDDWSSIALREGYHGLLLMTADRKPLAQWLSERGSTLIQQHED